ncbi:MAG: hypothetical protein SOT46_04615 [Treponema sp.]|nr:hypothetical protein [Treponema sp.]
MRDSKPRNNALHAFCGIETIELLFLITLRNSVKNHVSAWSTCEAVHWSE